MDIVLTSFYYIDINKIDIRLRVMKRVFTILPRAWLPWSYDKKKTPPAVDYYITRRGELRKRFIVILPSNVYLLTNVKRDKFALLAFNIKCETENLVPNILF